jgi:predicted transcriptional regulator of viral defense system
MGKDIVSLLDRNGGVIRTNDFVNAGYSRMTVVNLARSGIIERVAHGIYVKAGELYDEMYALSLRSERIIFSHETALWLNGLSDREPLEFHVTIPTGAPLGSILRSECHCHYVKRELHNLGLAMRKTDFGHEVRCYNAERTICDMIRNEKKVGIEALVGGLKAYAECKEKNLPGLIDMARFFSIEKETSRYMGVLL